MLNKNFLKKGRALKIYKKAKMWREIVDMLHSFSLFIYKRQLAQSHPHRL